MTTPQYVQWDPVNLAGVPTTPIQTSAGAVDAGKMPALNSQGVIDSSMLPPASGGSGTTTFVFVQTQALDIWTINHNLNKYPSVTVVDSAGSLAVGAVSYTDANNIVLTFGAPFSGQAFLN